MKTITIVDEEFFQQLDGKLVNKVNSSALEIVHQVEGLI